jgi:hypothetical protein
LRLLLALLLILLLPAPLALRLALPAGLRLLALLLALIIVATAAGLLRDAGSAKTWRSWLRENGWVVLPLSAIVLIPSSILGFVKIGGYVNNFALSHAFFALGATVGIAALWPLIQQPALAWLARSGLCAMIIARGVQVLLAEDNISNMLHTIRFIKDNPQQIVYDYAQKYPAAGYFPWHNLPTLLADGKLYGRGACDTKGIIAAMLEAGDRLRRNGTMNFGSGGVGTTPHMAGELFAFNAGIKMVHVAYRGEAPGINDLLGGQIPFMFSNLSVVKGNVEAGKLRALAVTSARRVPSLPNVPTIAETFPGFDAATWFVLVGPAGMPREAIMRINAETKKIVATADFQQRLDAIGMFPDQDRTPDEINAYIKTEVAKWAKVIADAGVKPAD